MKHVIRMRMLLGVAAVAVAGCAKVPVVSGSSEPEIPFEDVGACPFECCTYRAWTASESTDLRSDRSPQVPLVASIRQDDAVTGLTGVVVTQKAGRALVVGPLEIKGENNEPGISPSVIGQNRPTEGGELGTLIRR